MESEADRSWDGKPEDPSSSASNCFECNICFEMAEDPILTLCGHLYCWPCLYQWLHAQASSHRCPVCNASVEEQTLVPIYGRGKSSRSYSSGNDSIPRRPTGQRPETAPASDRYPQQGPGFFPMEAVRMGSLTLSAAFGGIFPAVFPFIFPAMMHFQVHGGLHDATMYGMTPGFPFGVYNPFHGGHDRGYNEVASRGQVMDNSVLKIWFLLVGLAVIFYLIC